MALTPEQVKSKDFLVGIRGYDKREVDTFLTEVAAELHEARDEAARLREVAEAAQARASEAVESARRATSEATRPGDDDWARLGVEVAAVLRTAEQQAAGATERAETDAVETRRAAQAWSDTTRAEAEQEATQRQAEAEAQSELIRAEADADRQEAKRALAAAQDESLSIVGDAQTRADRMLTSTEERSRSRSEEILTEARGRLKALTDTESAARARLLDVQSHVKAALENHDQATAKARPFDQTTSPEVLE